MIIGIDIRVLGSHQKSGIEEYTENLLEHLIPLDPTIKYKLFYSSWHDKLPNYKWLEEKNVEVYKNKIPNKVLFTSARIFNRPYIDEMVGGADIFFSPHFFILPLSPICKRVTTIHDLSFAHFKDFFSWRKILWHNFEMNPIKQTKQSDHIISVSISTKKDLEKFYGIDPAKITVIHSGISNNIVRPNQEMLDDFRIRNNLPNNFILFLGKIEPRKNITGIIRAFNEIKKINKFSDLHLVIAGARGWLYNDVFRELNKSASKKYIKLVDYISDDDKNYYYSLSKCFIYPSFFEGFGFPNIEAIKCGIPVITSNNAAIPEVVKNSALLVNPNSVNELTQAIKIVLTENKVVNYMASVSKMIVDDYNWHKSANKTLEIIQSVK